MAKEGEGTYYQDIGLAILKGPLRRFQIEQHVESARRLFTDSVFWESLGRLLALKLVVEDDDGFIRANWEGDLEDSIEELDSSAAKTPEKKNPVELCFNMSRLHEHLNCFRAYGKKVDCDLCGRKEATHRCFGCE